MYHRVCIIVCVYVCIIVCVCVCVPHHVRCPQAQADGRIPVAPLADSAFVKLSRLLLVPEDIEAIPVTELGYQLPAISRKWFAV